MSDHYPIELLIQSSYQTSASDETSFTGWQSETSPSYQTSVSDETSALDDTTTPSYLTYDTSSALRVGAFNIHSFGTTKVSNEDVLNILVQVGRRRLCYSGWAIIYIYIYILSFDT